MSNHAGEKDCGRRFKVGSGYKGCMCDYHVRRREYAEKYRREEGVEPREERPRLTHAAKVRMLRAKEHGGNTFCKIPDCGAGPFKSEASLPIHFGKVHKGQT